MPSLSLAVIPARGGSKRIPRKNIKPFLGRPVIQYSIETALASGLFSRVLVSTDDREIAAVAREAGAWVPFLRSGASSDDTAPLADVAVEVLRRLEEMNERYDTLCLILPAAPLLSAESLRAGYAQLMDTGCDSVVPVVRFSYPVQRALCLENDRLRMMWPEHELARSQDLAETYHDAGQFYWIRTEQFTREPRIFTGNSAAVVIPDADAQDIDTPEDWVITEQKYQLKLGRAAGLS